MVAIIIKSTAEYCPNILHSDKFNNLPFHNFAHTQEVIENVFLISDTMRIEPEEVDFIAIADCSHNTGFSETY